MGAKIYQNKKYIAFFLIPAFVFMLIFLYYPFIQNIINSFQHIKYMGTAADKWNAPFYKNYLEIFKDPKMLIALKNTGIMIIATIVGEVGLAIVLSLLVSNIKKGAGFFRVVYFFPIVISATALGLLFNLVFLYDKGMINQLLQLIGVLDAGKNELIDWKATHPMFTMLVPVIWQYVGFYFIILLTGLSGIPEDLYEAAEIERVLSVSGEEITGIEVLKKGMTNRSFLFRCRGGRYIMRIPGEGTSLLINRRQEAAVYRTLDGKGICDEIVSINPENGYKITKYLEGARVCDPENPEDVQACMKKLRSFHEEHLSVEHTFSLFDQIAYYESLWEGEPSVYRDYSTTKAHVLELEAYLEAQPKVWTLTHIDAVPDNFLFVEKNGGTEIRLIDWEYAGMQDAHVDLAMFCIYAMYDRPQVDALIDSYFTEGCPQEVRTKIYAYIAVCGLLWSNWCEYKSRLGVEFGEYSLKQYRYAKDYYKLVKQELAKSKGQEE